MTATKLCIFSTEITCLATTAYILPSYGCLTRAYTKATSVFDLELQYLKMLKYFNISYVGFLHYGFSELLVDNLISETCS